VWQHESLPQQLARHKSLAECLRPCCHLNIVPSLRSVHAIGFKTGCKAHNDKFVVSRRDQLAAALLAPAAQLLLKPAVASAESEAAVKQYLDSQDSFQLTIPAGWVEAETTLEGNSSFTGSSGARRTLVWYPPDTPADQVNVTLTITNTSAEFTRLGR